MEWVKRIADEKLSKYAAMVCDMDDAVGKLLISLKEHKLADNTLVCFFSDNGGPVGETNCHNNPLRGAKGQLYEGRVRVPFVESWPAALKPGKFDQPVSLLDVFLTAVAPGGGEVPKEVPLDGINLIPYLKGEAKSWLADRSLFWRTGGGEHFAMRKGSHKLVRVGKKPAELFDLSADIAEKKDLPGTKADTAAELQNELDPWNITLVAPKWGPLNAPPKI
jgi:arylsulfatase A-like enzyme